MMILVGVAVGVGVGLVVMAPVFWILWRWTGRDVTLAVEDSGDDDDLG
jgi:hypothetical protein